MSKYAKGLLISAITAAVFIVSSVIMMLLAPSNTSALMRLGVFFFLYSSMAEIVIWRLFEEFKKADLLRKRDYL